MHIAEKGVWLRRILKHIAQYCRLGRGSDSLARGASGSLEVLQGLGSLMSAVLRTIFRKKGAVALRWTPSARLQPGKGGGSLALAEGRIAARRAKAVTTAPLSRTVLLQGSNRT